MEKRCFVSVMERCRHWKTMVLLLVLLFMTWLSHVHWNIYKSRVPGLVKGGGLNRLEIYRLENCPKGCFDLTTRWNA